MAKIKLTNVKKVYDNGVTAVHDFNLDIDDKEFIVFVGPSGCGKSTTLRMIAGLEEITDGTLEIDGRVVNDLQPKDRDIAMVFQNYALYPHLTVFENIAFPLRLCKQNVTYAWENEVIQYQINEDKKKMNELINDINSKYQGKPKLEQKLNEVKTKFEEKIKKQEDAYNENLKKINAGETEPHLKKLNADEVFYSVVKTAEILDITDYLTRKPRALSGGQRQRVAIGRAMVRNSKVFLMDEPLSNLDAKLRNQMRAEIILLRKKINSTFIYVTHDQTEAMTLGDRIVIMKDGYIQQIGTPVDVFDMPANLFVAEFIGAPKMNTVKAELVENSGNYSIKVFGTELPIVGEKAQLLANKSIKSMPIILGIRPEHFNLSSKEDNSSFEVSIEVNEMMGSEIHIHTISPTGEKLIVRIPTLNLTSEQKNSIVTGNKLFLTFEGKAMHFFDVETEKNILL